MSVKNTEQINDVYISLIKYFVFRDIRREIDTLQEKGRLNHLAIDYIYKFILICTTITFIICFIVFLSDGWVDSLIMMSLLIFIIYFPLHFHQKAFRSFLYGKKKQFVVVQLKRPEFIRTFPFYHITCQDLDGDIKIKIPLVPDLEIEKNHIEEGTIVTVWYAPDKKASPVLDTEYFKKMYCLDNSL